jgi:hypothetical protein
MADEGENLVLRHLRELRARMDDGFRQVDERLVKLELRMGDVEGLLRKTHGEVVSLSRRVGALERQRS